MQEDYPPPAAELEIEDDALEFIESLLQRFRSAQNYREHRRKYPGLKGVLTKTEAPNLDVFLDKSEVFRVCCLASKALIQQNSLVVICEDALPINIVGDLHGQFRELRAMITACGEPTHESYLFLGDYVDRGPQSVETFIFLLCLRLRYPSRVFLLRGNHEDYNTCLIYGFYDECQRRFPECTDNSVFQNFIHVFNCLPFAGLICGRILAMHGGISPDIATLDDINRIKRPTFVPLFGIATDLVWADPSINSCPGWCQNPRGISFSFDDTTAEKFCNKFDLDFIVRGHQITNEMSKCGYMFTPNCRVLTVFSAFNYLNTGNTGATLRIQPGLTAKFRLFRPIKPARRHGKSKHQISIEPSE